MPHIFPKFSTSNLSLADESWNNVFRCMHDPNRAELRVLEKIEEIGKKQCIF